jgi:hypothetical protein
MKLCLLVILLCTGFSCTEMGKSGVKKPSIGNNSENPNDQGQGQHTCQVNNIYEVLENAQTAFVQMKNRSQGVFNIDSRLRLNQFNHPYRYYKISSTGKYLIEKVSNDIFTLRNNLAPSKTFNIVVSSRDKTDIEFSPDEKYVVMRYKATYSNSVHRVEIYSLENRKRVYSERFFNIKFIAMNSRDELVLGISDRQNKVEVWNWQQQVKINSITLPAYSNFNLMKVTKDRIITRSRRSYLVYEMDSPKIVFESRNNYLYTTNNNANLALFVTQGWRNLELVDLVNGDIVYTLESANDVFASTCKIRSDRKTLVCKHQNDPKQLIRWNLQSDTKEAFCL